MKRLLNGKKPVSLEEVRTAGRRSEAKRVRSLLFGRCRAAANQMGDDIAGFAVVVWDRDGYLRSAYEAGSGPIQPPLVPTLVSDALNRHLAVVLAEERITGSVDE